MCIRDRLQVPVIDLQKCLGCGTCVRECPEEGVLALVHGQAAVVNPAGCVGHARCVTECPAAAVTLSQGDLSQRKDVPVLDQDLQSVGNDGVYLVGEITARSLIRTATTQGAQVGATIAARCLDRADAEHQYVLDVVIVGAGPGGLACALSCREHGLDFVVLDQESSFGGTVAKYPRRKLVLTDDVTLPLHGRMARREYQKEELVELWQRLAKEHQLPFSGGVTFDRIERHDDDTFTVHSDGESVRARHVVLAVGRQGSPRRLSVPGEDLPHVTYGLLDAAAYADRHCVVVGGGDSAVETALALAEQPGNDVTIVYRQDGFFRLRSKNRKKLEHKLQEGALATVLSAIPVVEAVAQIHPTFPPTQGSPHAPPGWTHQWIVPSRAVLSPYGTAPVRVSAAKADIRISDRAATTTLEFELHNPANRVQEAVLLLPVPDGAAVSNFTFDGPAAEPTAKILPRDEARRLYDQITARMKDPALLEFSGYGCLRSSVFPVQPNGRQKIRLTYDHVLEVDGARVDYVLSLIHI